MRLILLILVLAACTNFPQREPVPVPTVEPIRQEQPEPTPKKERPHTIITINPPAKPQPICVPLAVDERKRILQAMDCLIEAEKMKK